MANEAAKRMYHKRRAEGLCVRCGKPADGRSQCDDCRPQRNAYERQRDQERADALRLIREMRERERRGPRKVAADKGRGVRQVAARRARSTKKKGAAKR